MQRILLVQLAAFILGMLLISWPPLRMAFVARAVQRARAHREATEQFFARGLTRTRTRCGVLIFVSIAERYARIIADHGIADRVPDAAWAEALEPLLAHLRQGNLAEGLLAAIERCGAVLAREAPADGTRDELPDRLYIL